MARYAEKSVYLPMDYHAKQTPPKTRTEVESMMPALHSRIRKKAFYDGVGADAFENTMDGTVVAINYRAQSYMVQFDNGMREWYYAFEGDAPGEVYYERKDKK